MYLAVKMGIHLLETAARGIVIPLFSSGDPWEEKWALCGLVIGPGVEIHEAGYLVGG